MQDDELALTASGAHNLVEEEDAAGLSPYIRRLVNETLSVSVATVGFLLDPNNLHRPTQSGNRKTEVNAGMSAATNATAASTSQTASKRNSNLAPTISKAKSKRAGIHGGSSADTVNHNSVSDEEIIVEQKVLLCL
jgi:hypothetical protein